MPFRAGGCQHLTQNAHEFTSKASCFQKQPTPTIKKVLIMASPTDKGVSHVDKTFLY